MHSERLSCISLHEDLMRKVTVTYALGERRSVPMIRLRGDWLAQAGFREGTRVQVDVIAGKLTLTATDESTDRSSQ